MYFGVPGDPGTRAATIAIETGEVGPLPTAFIACEVNV